ncbi:hypothetical protein [Chitinophaga nivalis]|uniref:Reverse transcriptase/retrotransposon-derived protein RNase H-like domain-containing protein n=1 Tax=Chitinophaga nivalis TaxID=2991709 RepID=A0ABT3IT85_9BACT|nr:hypothetical protein [Chitinophaga nivalis]MCW3463125.1 hypothetical protein [Chitinophaga nivalis]MCW3487185.1 hypothetical protein [Chitinophaga nivalis]
MTENKEKLEIILIKFLQDLAALPNQPIEMLSITLTMDAACFPTKGHTYGVMIEGQRKQINEQRGTDPLLYHIACYEK